MSTDPGIRSDRPAARQPRGAASSSASTSIPHRFDAEATIGAVVAAHGSDTGEALEATHVRTRVAGRILGVRTFGKANFLVLSDGVSRLQVYIRQDSVPERAFQIFKLLDFGDWVGVEGRLFRTKTNELTVWVSDLDVPGQVPAAAAGEVARPARTSRRATASATSI